MRVLPLILLFAVAAPAQAQQPSVAVPISNADPMACSTARMMDLRRLENPRRRPAVLAVRTAPSRRAAMLAQLPDGANVFACLRRGDWFGIVFAAPGQRRDCGVSRQWRRAGPYRGPCRSGWVHDDHIGAYADWISP